MNFYFSRVARVAHCLIWRCYPKPFCSFDQPRFGLPMLISTIYFKLEIVWKYFKKVL